MIVSKSLNDFRAWLGSDSSLQFMLKRSQPRYEETFAHMQVNDKFDYLFVVRAPSFPGYDDDQHGICRYAGLYSRRDRKVYDMPWYLQTELSRVGDISGFVDMETHSRERVETEIGETVVALIDNDRTRFEIDQTPPTKQFDEETIAFEAMKLFMGNKELVTSVPMRCNYRLSYSLNTNEWFEYLDNRNVFLREKATEYIETNKKQIPDQFAFNDRVWKKYQEIAADPEWSVVKALKFAVEESQAKTVNVTFRKKAVNAVCDDDVVTETFKVNATAFTIYGKYRTTLQFELHPYYYMTKAEYERFVRVYDDHERYGEHKVRMDEIALVTYRGKTLYRK